MPERKEPEPPEHKSELAYYTSDDGVYLRCDTDGWETNLDFRPSVEKVNEAWQAHLAEWALGEPTVSLDG